MCWPTLAATTLWIPGIPVTQQASVLNLLCFWFMALPLWLQQEAPSLWLILPPPPLPAPMVTLCAHGLVENVLTRCWLIGCNNVLLCCRWVRSNLNEICKKAVLGTLQFSYLRMLAGASDWSARRRIVLLSFKANLNYFAVDFGDFIMPC